MGLGSVACPLPDSARLVLTGPDCVLPGAEVKIVLSDRGDYEWAKRVIEEHGLVDRVNAVLLSCVWGELDPQDLVQWVLQDKLPVRVQIQVHKVIWGPNTQGV